VLIIVDGPDCSGKSTLVAALRDRLATRYLHDEVHLLHRGPPTGHPLDEYEVPLLTYRASGSTHVVCDRWHLGELVYPDVFGRSTEFTEPVLRHVELFLNSRGALLVHVDAEVDELRACLERRGDEVVTVDQVVAIREGFVDAVTRTGLPVVYLDANDVRSPATIEWLLGEAEALTNGRAYTDKIVTYVGPRWPKLLLLGDVRATVDGDDDPRPAFMPYTATSGHYLLNALGDATRHGVGIANACDVDDPKGMWYSLGQPDTVSLGINAQRAVTWDARHVPHPQYVRRFHNTKRNEYRDAILGVRPWSNSV
jgi:thymidylate kinase